MLASAERHYRTQQEITAAGLSQARRARWGTLAGLTTTVAQYQALAARTAAVAFPLMLAEQGLTAPAAGATVFGSLVGWASDGRSLAGLLDYTRSGTVTDDQFDRIVTTQLQDVARQAEAIEIGARPAVTGYVRMLNMPSCSRCIILSGRFYRWSDGFERHPKCDCKHVPTTRDAAGDLAVPAREAFDSLTPAEQDRTFTKAGAEAIRLGADPGKVVNARSGMNTAQINIKGRYTARGRLVRDESGLFTTEAGASGGARLMPESILEIAEGRADAIRLLKAHGYLT